MEKNLLFYKMNIKSSVKEHFFGVVLFLGVQNQRCPQYQGFCGSTSIVNTSSIVYDEPSVVYDTPASPMWKTYSVTR